MEQADTIQRATKAAFVRKCESEGAASCGTLRRSLPEIQKALADECASQFEQYRRPCRVSGSTLKFTRNDGGTSRLDLDANKTIYTYNGFWLVHHADWHTLIYA